MRHIPKLAAVVAIVTIGLLGFQGVASAGGTQKGDGYSTGSGKVSIPAANNNGGKSGSGNNCDNSNSGGNNNGNWNGSGNNNGGNNNGGNNGCCNNGSGSNSGGYNDGSNNGGNNNGCCNNGSGSNSGGYNDGSNNGGNNNGGSWGCGYPGTTSSTYKQKPPPKAPPPPPPYHNPFPIVYYRYPTCVPFQVTSYPGNDKGSQGGKGGTDSGYKLVSVDNTSHGHK